MAALFGSSHAVAGDGDAAIVAGAVAVATDGGKLLADATGLAVPPGDPPEQPPNAVAATSSIAAEMPAP
jgi:hypothetical protein